MSLNGIFGHKLKLLSSLQSLIIQCMNVDNSRDSARRTGRSVCQVGSVPGRSVLKSRLRVVCARVCSFPMRWVKKINNGKLCYLCYQLGFDEHVKLFVSGKKYCNYFW